jgi:plasmid maintenance system killer protein
VMITRFKPQETESIFRGRVSLKYPRSIQIDALRKLRIIDAATSLDDLQILGCLDRLSSNRRFGKADASLRDTVPTVGFANANANDGEFNLLGYSQMRQLKSIS